MTSGGRHDDERYMRRAIELAVRAAGRTSPNPLVGAVLVRDGRVVGEGYHARAGTDHAEVVAIKAAGELARGATLYVTLEPCSHFGRTPPCADAVIRAGISRVVAATQDPNPKVAGRGFQRLRDAGIAVETGVCESESRAINEPFIHFMTMRRPLVTLKWAMSMDGKIATRTGDSRWVSGEEARLRVHRMRDVSNAILVGVGTVLRDDPALTTRLPDRESKDPARIVLDSEARTPPEARILRTGSAAPTIIAVAEDAPRERTDALERAGAELWRLPRSAGNPDAMAGTPDAKAGTEPGGRPGLSLHALMERLAEREWQSLLVEGGASVHASFIENGLADRFVVFLSPKIVGGAAAPGPVAGLGIERMADALRLEIAKWEAVGEDLLITARATTA